MRSLPQRTVPGSCCTSSTNIQVAKYSCQSEVVPSSTVVSHRFPWNVCLEQTDYVCAAAHACPRNCICALRAVENALCRTLQQIEHLVLGKPLPESMSSNILYSMDAVPNSYLHAFGQYLAVGHFLRVAQTISVVPLEDGIALHALAPSYQRRAPRCPVRLCQTKQPRQQPSWGTCLLDT